jgi:diguanylate cyclase (GGDEF)-like protein
MKSDQPMHAESTSSVNNIADELLKKHHLLEVLLVVSIIAATAWMWFSAAANPVVLHLYYVPVVLTGFFRGAYRARLMSLLSILTATIIFLPGVHGEAFVGAPLGHVFAFALWGATLVLIAVLVGTLSDGWREMLINMQLTHEQDVLTDGLTGVADRREFEYELTRCLAKWHRDQTPLCLALFDIDHFKKLNDRHGHQAGDAVLKAVAKILQQTVRETDLVARYGGEEFGIILPGAHVQDAKDVVERIRSLIESSRTPYNGLTLRLTASLGVAQITVGEDSTSLVQRADAALYCSKEAGRNCVHFHNGNDCQRFGHGIATEPSCIPQNNYPQIYSNNTYTDETTGLPTRKVFLEEFRRRTLEAHRYGGQMSIAIVTIDTLLKDHDHDTQTQINLMTTIARLAGSVLREVDLITRYNANSLSILLPSTSLSRALTALQRLSNHAADYNNSQYPLLVYNVSIGFAEIRSMEPPGSTLQRVESALATAIAANHPAVCFHDGCESQLTHIPHVVNAHD